MTTPSPPAQDFEQIVRDHQALVFRTLARLLGQSADLDDLAQDVFLRLYRALPTFRGDAQLSTYLYRITLNVAHDAARRRTQDRRRNLSLSTPISSDREDLTLESTLPHPAPTAEAQLQHAHFAQAVDLHLQQLSHIERSILVLFHQEDQTYEQIAHTLAIPINTVRTHLHRARTRLRKALLADATKPHPAPSNPKAIQYAL